MTTETATVLLTRMSELHTIFSAPKHQADHKNVAASDGVFQSEKEQAREVEQIVADLAKKTTAWLYEPERDDARAWAGLR